MTEPLRFVPCAFCGREVNPHSRLTYTRVQGWDRPGRAGGSDVVLRERLAEWAHPQCIERERMGVSHGQQALT